MNRITSIKARFPDARSMAIHLGHEVPERDGVKFSSPFRPDRSPSCSFKNGLFYDWSKGDGKGLDSIAYFAAAKGIDNLAAILALTDAKVSPSVTPPPKTSKTISAEKPAKPPFRKLETPTPEDLGALAKLRNIHDTALHRAADLGHLFFGDTSEGRAYVVTDDTRKACQSRRIDGQPWKFIAAKSWTSVKAHGLAGWPLGAADIGQRERVILCEGGPDWLVAHEAEPEIAVCCMLGAKQTIHAEALQHFAGKSVRILAHGDEAGSESCKRWATQLATVRARVTAIPIKFGTAHDLNDCTGLSFGDWRKFNLSALLT